MIINRDREYKTKDGRDVDIFLYDGKPPFSVYGAIKCNCGWRPAQWTPLGEEASFNKNSNLVEIRRKFKRMQVLKPIRQILAENLLSVFTPDGHLVDHTGYILIPRKELYKFDGAHKVPDKAAGYLNNNLVGEISVLVEDAQ